MWRCPRCETLNTDEVCIICGQKRADLDYPEQVEPNDTDIFERGQSYENFAYDKQPKESESEPKKPQKTSVAVFVTVVLLIIIFISIIVSNANVSQSGNQSSNAVIFTYTVTNSIAKITEYNGAGGAVTIPNTLGGYPVTSIDGNAFYSGTGTTITTIIIPSSVTSIGENAFEYCSSLTSITIPSSVTSFGSGVFGSCKSLTSVTIQSGVTIIGWAMFYDCPSLTSITIPSSVTSIGEDAFSGCSKLIIYGDNGSFAQTYANNNKIPFKVI
jgi:hypothetical protein